MEFVYTDCNVGLYCVSFCPSGMNSSIPSTSATGMWRSLVTSSLLLHHFTGMCMLTEIIPCRPESQWHVILLFCSFVVS
jgi:hypothetical protein